jgi:hypothetical protein
LRENTTFQIGWSYVLAWMGIGFSLLSSIAYIAAKFSIRNDIKVKTKTKTTFYNELSLEIVVHSLEIVVQSLKLVVQSLKIVPYSFRMTSR